MAPSIRLPNVFTIFSALGRISSSQNLKSESQRRSHLYATNIDVLDIAEDTVEIAPPNASLDPSFSYPGDQPSSHPIIGSPFKAISDLDSAELGEDYIRISQRRGSKGEMPRVYANMCQ